MSAFPGFRTTIAFALALLLGACGDDETSDTVDNGAPEDASGDSTTDDGADGVSRDGEDSSEGDAGNQDATEDAGRDAVLDSGADQTEDAVLDGDADEFEDAGHDTGLDVDADASEDTVDADAAHDADLAVDADADVQADADTDADAPETDGPIVTVLFPASPARTNAESLTIRGTAEDVSSISRVAVGETEADTEDDWATWSIEVDLEPGLNEITIIATDVLGNSSEEMLEISAQILLLEPTAMNYPSGADFVLVTDDFLGGLYSLDLETGYFSVISDENVGEGPGESFDGIALDGARDRILVTSQRRDSAGLIEVDPDTGVRELFSSDEEDLGPPFVSAEDIHIDGSRALVTDRSAEALLYFVALADGKRTALDAGEGPGIDRAEAVTMGPTVPLVLDSGTNRVISIDSVEDGAHSVVTGGGTGSGPSMSLSTDIAYHEDVGFLALTRFELLSVDLENGDRATVSSGEVGEGPEFPLPSAVEILDSDTALVLDANLDGVIAVDLESGDRTEVTNVHIGEGPSMAIIGGMTYDHVSGNIYVGESGDGALIEITPGGDRTYVNEPTEALGGLHALCVDHAGDRVLVADGQLQQLAAIDRVSGEVSIISSSRGDGIGDGLPMSRLRGVVLLDEDTALLLDQGLPDLIVVDLDSGDRELLRGPEDAAAELQKPTDIVADLENNQVFIVDEDLDALVAVDLETLETTVIAKAGVGSGSALFQPTQLALDADAGVIYVHDAFSQDLFSVDIETGDRTSIGSAEIGIGPMSFDPMVYGLELVGDTGTLLSLDRRYSAIVHFDIETGERLLVSH